MTINNTFQKKCIKKTYYIHVSLDNNAATTPAFTGDVDESLLLQKKKQKNLLGFLINSALHLSHSASVTYFGVSCFI